MNSFPANRRPGGRVAANGRYYCLECRTPTGGKKAAGCHRMCRITFFQSAAELDRAAELALLEDVGKISGLLPHPRFALVVNGTEIGTYVADFKYSIEGSSIVEDVKPKGQWEKWDRLAALKIKIFRALHPAQRFYIHQ